MSLHKGIIGSTLKRNVKIEYHHFVSSNKLIEIGPVIDGFNITKGQTTRDYVPPDERTQRQLQ